MFQKQGKIGRKRPRVAPYPEQEANTAANHSPQVIHQVPPSQPNGRAVGAHV